MAPALHYAILERSPATHLAMSVVLSFAAALTLAAASVVLTSALLCTLVCVGFICPMWLVRIQKFKAQINGPWDEAVPKISLQRANE
jgi:phosphatidylinositol glycan class C protein